MSVRIEARAGAVRLTVRAQPRASRSEIVGEHDGALKVRVAAPPVEGEANRELLRFLAKTLGLPPSSLRVAAGESGRTKVVEIEGLSVADVERRLGL